LRDVEDGEEEGEPECEQREAPDEEAGNEVPLGKPTIHPGAFLSQRQAPTDTQEAAEDFTRTAR